VVSATGTYAFDNGLAVNADLSHVDSVFSGYSQRVRLPGYWLLNAGASFTTGRWMLRVVVKNLNNARYFRAGGQDLFGADIALPAAAQLPGDPPVQVLIVQPLGRPSAARFDGNIMMVPDEGLGAEQSAWHLPVRRSAVAQAKGAASAPRFRASGCGALACKPGGACAARIPVKVVVVTMFEIGQDTGDAPGEFQFWRERRKLDVRIHPQSHHDLYYNPRARFWAW
jgi:hypothetical protein